MRLGTPHRRKRPRETTDGTRQICDLTEPNKLDWGCGKPLGSKLRYLVKLAENFASKRPRSPSMRGILASSFRVGDKVVYPNHGVGVIEQIALRSNGFTTERYYLLSIRSSSLKVTVPCQNATAVGLRGLVDKGEMDRILVFLAQAGESKNADWKERYREHMDKMKAGTLMEVAEVLKSLLVLHQTKELSVRERKTLERARYLLVNEMAQAMLCDELTVEDLVLGALSKSELKFPDVIGDEGAA